MIAEFQKNVFGEKLEECSDSPLTGWLRDGCCNTNTSDEGLHTVCSKVTDKFLAFLQSLRKNIHLICYKYLIVFT